MADPKDLRVWYEAESPSVRRYLLSLCRDPHLAEDLTQETFVQALLSLRGYRGGSVHAYLLAIARRVHARHVRRDQRRRDAEGLSSGPSPPGEPLQSLLDVLPDLPEDDRSLLLLRAVAGWSYADIARYLGRTENWARVRYFRVCDRLRREELVPEGGKPGG